MPPVAEAEGRPGGLSRADCLCPICLDIFLEPVTLPCSHTFCKPCFLETVDKANLSCPLCRKRVSSWARLHSRNKTLVNAELWSRVQEAFPAQCEQRLSGGDAGDMAAPAVSSKPRVSQPGELRKEYEDQMSRLAAEKQALEEAEQAASEQYIQRLLAEDEEHSAEEWRRQEEKQLEDDEKLARMLSMELNSSPEPEAQKQVRSTRKISAKKITNTGDIERFLQPLAQMGPISSSAKMERSRLDVYGWNEAERGEPDTRVSRPEQNDSTAAASWMEQDGDSGDPGIMWVREQPPGKRKSAEVGPEAADSLARKRPCHPNFLVDLEEKLQSQQQQEEEDWQLALRLQQQLDREEALRVVNRRKGSPDQYQLRQRPSNVPADPASRGRSHSVPEQKQEKPRVRQRGSSCGPPRAQRGEHASESPLPVVHKACKQSTLTEMFPPLNS
ncbi:E3 ubiquitin-protein ligase rnf168 isoform X2 [Brienomyrus brachyistius]|uniref:E3 ubiquitin-protein ligase rnf168 isoform X2 n=1 Tax=Brienomyrus brachyistius TaxID=42636 RepID=UPI0020B2D525|nr:E3 ubiquitin-protein ligase rnf168 isoform X2 [Brienomyrus brachyistius]